LRYDFEKLRDNAELWQYLTELYLLHRQIAYSPPKPGRIDKALAGNARLPVLLSTADHAMHQAVSMEHRHGSKSWPVASPDRGVTAYQFVHEILRHYIGAVTGEAVRNREGTRYVDSVTSTPVIEPHSTEAIWRQIVEWSRPGFGIGNSGQTTLEWPAELRQLRLEKTSMLLTGRSGSKLELPLPISVKPLTLQDGGRHVLRVRKTPAQLILEVVPSPATNGRKL
jgi:hypothetical protein